MENYQEETLGWGGFLLNWLNRILVRGWPRTYISRVGR